MRKETILNYEKEFLAWCKGESILLGAPASMHEKTLVWREVRDFNDWTPLDAVYVLNDSYSTYRKALAEGKSIQMLCKYDGMEPIWDDMTEVIKSIGFVDVKEHYRVKPEEPKFKVGDWVVEIHSTTKAQVLELFGNQIRVKFCYPDAIITTDCSDFIPWVPKPGEWCWVFNKLREVPILRRVIKVEDNFKNRYDDNKFSKAVRVSIADDLSDEVGYRFCEPFIGKLPTYISSTLSSIK